MTWAVLYQHMRVYDEAITEYKKAITLDPNFADSHINLGNVYDIKGDVPAAIREFREAKRINPNDPIARQNLGSALMGMAPAEAIRELKELEKCSPTSKCATCV